MNKIIEKHYKHTNNPNPVWVVERKVTTHICEFDCIDLATGAIIGFTNLHWKHDTADEMAHPMYHGCSYMFTGYNPIPATGWFYGIPKNQMLKWCAEHGLCNRRDGVRHVALYFVDACTWDEYNMVWRKPEPAIKRYRL